MSAPGKEIEAGEPVEGAELARDAGKGLDQTVLVIDDVPYMLELASLFLGRTARVVTATGGPAGLAAARELHPDLVLCDDFMPVLDGHAVCRAIRQDPALESTPLIMLLSDSSAQAHGAAIRAGANDCLAKPLERSSLVDRVARFLQDTRVRGLPRIDTELPVTLTSGRAEGAGTVRNLSGGGAFVETDLPLACADEVGLHFQLPDSTLALRPSAQVVWRRNRYEAMPEPDGVGFRFIELDAQSARALDDYVYERTSLAPSA
jgi:CheY-like chemotaxis protein/Tfp pilus assembly protein PilZ